MRISDWSSDVCSSDLLEGLHLMADRRLGDVQLAGRLGEGEVAGGGFEGPERVQGRQFPGHASIKKTYAKREITSFVGFSNSDRKSVVEGQSGSVRVVLGGRLIIKLKTYIIQII